MNLYEIKYRLENQERAVFSLNELSRIIGKPKAISVVYASRMLKKGLLFKIEKNKFSTSEDIFVTASQLAFPSYIGLSSSLYLQNLLSQVINSVYVLSPKQVKNKKILGTKVIFVKISPKLMFGYKKIKKENSFIFISDLEKTIIDCLLYPRYCRVGGILGPLKRADAEKLEYYLSKADKEVLNRKIGFLLDFLGRKHGIKRKTKTVYKLNPKIKRKGKFNSKWFLYINEELK